MRNIFIAGFALLLPTGATCQEVMDGSAKNLSSEVIDVMYARALEQFKDPYSLKFYQLHIDKDNADYVCGAYNAKNELGGYVGLRAFRFGIQNGVFINLNTPC